MQYTLVNLFNANIVPEEYSLVDLFNANIEMGNDNIQLLSPANGATGVSTSPTFQWVSFPNTQTYIIKVWDYTGDVKGDLIIKGFPATNQYSVPIDLQNSTKYLWQVVKGNKIDLSSPESVDEITGISISSGSTIDANGDKVFNISTTGTGNYDPSYTASGTGLTFSISGNILTVTDVEGSADEEKTFTVTSVEDNTVTASKTLTVNDPASVSNPTIKNDSAQGDVDAVNDLFTQTGGPEMWWDDDTGYPVQDVAGLKNAYGITVWESGPNAGRVRTLNLQENGLRNIDLAGDGRPLIKNYETDQVITVGADDQTSGGTSKLAGLAINSNDRYKERYVLLDGKEIKASIGNLQACEEFNITLNRLGGPLPDQAWALSSCIRWAIGYHKPQTGNPPANPPWTNPGYVTKYQQWFNKFEGRIHPNIDVLMPNLKSLLAVRNYFDNTEIPSSILNLELEQLYIPHCGLVGNFPDRDASPAFQNTLHVLYIFGGTAHSSRNDSSSYQHENNLHLSGTLSPSLGLPNLGAYRVNYNDFYGPIPQTYENLSGLGTVMFMTNFDGPFPLFFNKDKVTGMHTMYLSRNSFTPPPNGLPADYNLSGMSGAISLGGEGNPINGEIPDGWKDPDHPLCFMDKLQILGLGQCQLEGAMMVNSQGISTWAKFYNMKMCNCQDNKFDNDIFQDYPDNTRLTEFRWRNNNMGGVLRRTIRKIISPNFWYLDYGDNEISGYEKGALGAFDWEFDGDGNPVFRHKKNWDEIVDESHPDAFRSYTNGIGGHNFPPGNIHKRFWIKLNKNQLTQPDLDQIILDVYENLLQREGTERELTSNFVLDVSNQKTLEVPSNNTQINNAVAYMEQYGTVTL